MISPAEVSRRIRTRTTHRIHSLPVVVLMPHSRCNCRCLMCDIWKANADRRELTVDDLAPHLATFRRWHVRWVVLSGGEALLHGNLWRLCDLLRETGVARLTLLSTGLLLRKHAGDIVAHLDEVIVSLDGSREVHDRIRNVPNAFDRLADGVGALRAARPGFRVTGRAVLQRENFRDLPGIIEAARALGLDQISFLAADVTSAAFNRPDGWDGIRASEVALGPEEARAFRDLTEQVIRANAADFASRFIAESPDKLRRLPAYYAALNAEGDFPEVRCNAPWVSTVIEADGTVRPCFFHNPLGNIHDQPLDTILNSEAAVGFRRTLDVHRDPTCRRCVCTLTLGLAAP
jgi:MoaA/NifB/PqqE/SkfB family radical SAM enzyme